MAKGNRKARDRMAARRGEGRHGETCDCLICYEVRTNKELKRLQTNIEALVVKERGLSDDLEKTQEKVDRLQKKLEDHIGYFEAFEEEVGKIYRELRDKMAVIVEKKKRWFKDR